jgi:alkylation response protein AidB-like acyl-CoA dehydrogenase
VTVTDIMQDDDVALDAVGAWLDEQWEPALTVAEWWRRLAGARLSMPTLPPPWGRGWSQPRTLELLAVLGERGMLQPPYGMGNFLVTPTLLAHARSDLVERFVPAVLDGRHSWCQLFSEPGAGSDLAGLQTRAERDGDEWVVTGQKVWTSGGQYADYAILVARTDPTVPKHRGLTYFLIPMRQPGIEVRPLREMTGRAMFNEVFLDDARLPGGWVVGDVGDGWRVTNTTLRNERAGIGGEFLPHNPVFPGTVAGNLDRPAGEAAVDVHADRVVPAVDFGVLCRLAAESGRRDDPLVRQRLAQLHTLERISAWHLARMKAGGATTGVDGNLAKVRNSSQVALTRELGTTLVGMGATLWGDEAPTGGAVQDQIVLSPAPSIYGGADQIQRNIIGERGLGLPREPDASRDVPFSQLLHNPVGAGGRR